ncbi:WXG100 family type VII secretion target [Segniliparus rugosus]|uniref:ESAT-6-like protein n=1 Tax=Segniliparus rugosus (strain ATCC BAA-974 / DSM 45345 / CCUG 50838 / CIP 108380 / JCM 13579 / CDC 945) TaxID=679197 RepID=E5XKR1_SEGRC|nr:WXG100 family type VII secretion target [Segniliparus rugosus]EFV15054.1 WXG100 family type VII secretion target [Segniliparus rugosus ATCC BAA-974]
MPGKYVADLDQMDSTVSRMEAFENQVQSWTEEIDAEVKKLHVSWSGDAASAQQADHDRWTKDAQAAKEALEKLKAVMRKAHENYTGANTANKAMWAG